MKATHKIKIHRNLSLPESLNNSLLGLAKGVTLQNCYYLLWVIINDLRREFRSVESYKPLPNTRLVKMLGRHYNKPLYILINNGFIERVEGTGKHTCLLYRICPKYYNEDEMVNITFTYYSKMNSAEYQSMKTEKQAFLEVFNSLDIPYVKLHNKVQEKLSRMTVDDYTGVIDSKWGGHNRKVRIMDEFWNFEEVTMTKKKALEFAAESDKVLVLDEDRFLIVCPEDFIEAKKAQIRSTWTSSINNLKDEKSLYAARNSTNQRLDTNFTNMAGELFNIIVEHNGLQQLDVQNSQPALLSHVLKLEGITGKDVELFSSLTRAGKFYEYIGCEFEVSRKEAKEMTFEVLFGEYFNTKVAKSFAETFPTVAEYITGFKRNNGYKAFSVMLQELESSLFIDNIYYSLLDDGVKVITKHDSLVVSSEDYEAAKERAIEVFRSMDFEASLKNESVGEVIDSITGYTFDEQKTVLRVG